MKKRWHLFISAAVIAIAAVWAQPPRADALACANTSEYGAVSVTVPQLPRTGDYTLWIRLQSPSAPGYVSVDIDETACLEITSKKTAADQWIWVPYGTMADPQNIHFSHDSTHYLTIFGKTDGLKVDSIMLSEPGCVPKNLGENCSTKVIAEPGSNSEFEQLPPPSNDSVNGKIQLSDTPYKYGTQLTKLQYTVDGRTLQESSVAMPFDTTLLADGKYTVMITTTLDSGKVIRESTVIEIENPTNALSPIIRWIRLNYRSLTTWGIIAGSILTAMFLLWAIRRLYLRRRQRHFHGF